VFASVQRSNPIHGTQIVVSRDRQVVGCIGNVGAVEIALAEVGPEEKSVREDCGREACSDRGRVPFSLSACIVSLYEAALWRSSGRQRHVPTPGSRMP